jgi:tetratricopeptide (TPR) repeat protein
MNTKLISLFFRVLIMQLIAVSVVAQDGKKKNVEQYKDYRSRSTPHQVDVLLRDARKLKNSNPKAALTNVKEALGQSLAQNNILDEGKCYVLLGEINENLEEWKLALDNYQQAYEKLKADYQSTEEYRFALRGLGRTNLKLANYNTALLHFEKLLKSRIPVSEQNELRLDISEVQYQLQNYKAALAILDDITTGKIADEVTGVRVQNQRAKIYTAMNEVDKAKSAYLSSQNTLRSKKPVPAAAQKADDMSTQEAKEEVAGALHQQERYDEEIDLRNQAIELNLESNNLPEVTKDKVGISKALAAKGETNAAIEELEEAARIADTIHNPKEQARAYLALADMYDKNGRNTQALSAYKKYSRAVKKSEELNKNKLIEKSELILKQKDIADLTKDLEIGQREETIERATVTRQRLIIYGLLVIMLITLITSYFIYRSAQASKTANQLLALKSLRNQMNPHFIFNALNSVNHFIAQNDERTANKFLAEFSRLMRLVMEYSQEDFIPLSKEQEIISLYLKLEHYRFRDKFEYSIFIDDEINPESVELPPMLLQPYVENAVWHGLRYKETKGHLSLKIHQQGNNLMVQITDDGIGRAKSGELKTENQKKHNSTGLKNIQQRLLIINKVYGVKYRIDIEDLDPATKTGTNVRIYLPLHLRNGTTSTLGG